MKIRCKSHTAATHVTDKAHGPLVLQRFLLRTELSNVQITGPSRIIALYMYIHVDPIRRLSVKLMY